MITIKRKIYLLENIKNVIINTGEEYEWLIMMRKEFWEYKTMMCSNSKYEVNLYVKIEVTVPRNLTPQQIAVIKEIQSTL